MTLHHGLGTYGNATGTVTPLDHKADMAAWFNKLRLGTNAVRAGLFWDGVSAVVTGAANMSYNVGAFTAIVSRGASSGVVPISNDGTVNLGTDPAPGSDSRYDLVLLWQREFSLDGTDSEPQLIVLRGTSNATPTVPDYSAYPGAIPLAKILVPTGVTATNSGTTITQLYPLTTVDGGTVHVPDVAARDRSFPAPKQGDYAFRIDLGIEERYYEAYNATTNARGARLAGWYPSGRGEVPHVDLHSGSLAVSYSAGNNILAASNTFNSEGGDFGGMTSGASAITVPYDGIYEVTAVIEFSSGPINLYVNTSSTNPAVNTWPGDSGSGSGSSNYRNLHVQIVCAANEPVRVCFAATTGGSIPTGVYSRRFSVKWHGVRRGY